VGFVFQQFNLLPTLTAEENITLPLAIAGRRLDRAWQDRVVDAVGLAGRLGHRPAQLSGGGQQRVACARALATRPQVIFADEPTGNLDTRSGTEVLRFLQQSVRDLGQTVVTHDPHAASYADRVVFLTDGRIVGELADPTAELVLERTNGRTPTHVPGRHTRRGPRSGSILPTAGANQLVADPPEPVFDVDQVSRFRFDIGQHRAQCGGVRRLEGADRGRRRVARWADRPRRRGFHPRRRGGEHPRHPDSHDRRVRPALRARRPAAQVRRRAQGSAAWPALRKGGQQLTHSSVAL
jgi:energy-coupling factor transporter ATP-binding protein EcfA2